MRKIAVVCVFFILVGILSGCGKEEKIDAPNVLLPAVFHDGAVYVSTFKQIPGEVEESAILGHIRSVVPLFQWPGEEGQSNYEIMDAPYAMTGDGLVVLIRNEWTLFKPLEPVPEATEAVPEWYSQEQAMIEGFVVVQDGDVRHNAGRWQAYMEAVEQKEPADITILHFIRSEEDTTQIWLELRYDGKHHYLTRWVDGVKTEAVYRGLRKQQISLDDSWEPYDSSIRYLLEDEGIQEILFEDLIVEMDVSGVTEIAFHLKEGEQPLETYGDPSEVEKILSLLKKGEYLPGDLETYYYGTKLIMTNGEGEQLIVELDLNQGNYRYGMQTYHYGDISDLLSVLGLEDWPEAVYAEHGDYIGG